MCLQRKDKNDILISNFSSSQCHCRDKKLWWWWSESEMFDNGIINLKSMTNTKMRHTIHFHWWAGFRINVNIIVISFQCEWKKSVSFVFVHHMCKLNIIIQNRTHHLSPQHNNTQHPISFKRECVNGLIFVCGKVSEIT